MHVPVHSMHMCTDAHSEWSEEGALDTTELQLKVLVSCQVGREL